MFESIRDFFFGPEPSDRWKRRFDENVTRGLAAPPVDRLIDAFHQSTEGNCASFAVVKEGLRSFGGALFPQVQQVGDGYNVCLRDGSQVHVNYTELKQAWNAMDAKGTPEGCSLAVLAFAILARRAPGGSFEEALKSLNGGEDPRDIARYLGVGHEIRPVGPDSEHFVVQSSEHGLFVDGGKADAYGRPVPFDGTDTKRRLIRTELAFTLDGTAWPAQKWRVTANPTHARSIPQALDEEILTRTAKRLPVTSVAIAPDDSFVALHGRNGYLAGGNIDPELIATLRKLHQEKQVIKSVALAPDGGCALLHGDRGYSLKGVPAGLLEAVKRQYEAGSTLEHIALGPNGSYALTFDGHGYAVGGVDRQMVEHLDSIHAARGRVDGVTLAPDGGWVVINNDNGWSGVGVPAEMCDKLSQLNRAGSKIESVCVTRNGWVVTQ